jgi:hypothetical protein
VPAANRPSAFASGVKGVASRSATGLNRTCPVLSGRAWAGDGPEERRRFGRLTAVSIWPASSRAGLASSTSVDCVPAGAALHYGGELLQNISL